MVPQVQATAAMLPAHAEAYRRTLGIVGTSRDGEGLEDWRRHAVQLDLQASSTAEGSLKELQVIGCLSDTESHELLDHGCLGLEQVASIDLQDEVRKGG